MKVLTVRQPWAYLIIQGSKDIENRTWRTSHRGPLLIHAGKAPDREGLRWFREECRAQGVPVPHLATGAIIGGVTVTDCVTDSDSDWFTGPVGWALADPFELLDPIPARGALGLWDADIDLDWGDD